MIRKNDFIQLIAEGDFKHLFITELGWNQFRAQSELPTITIDERDYNIKAIAERNGFQILTCKVDQIPTNSTCRKIDGKLRRQANDYICIFTLGDTQHHLWVVPVKTNEKRELTLVEYESAQKSDLLYSKVEGFSFELDEFTTIVDLRDKVQGAFVVNSEKITKDFYAGFRKEHTAFIRYISGMDDDLPLKDNRNKEWYTSVMLNRLMFCYFVQKKGFLNNDHNYLGNQLKRIKKLQGGGQYYSFYRSFLRHLFSDGLNLPKHSLEWERTYGKIPYLNGGMFDEHQLEREYPDIDIADEAFERLFAFFDTWEWHLDTRITASGKDINPDVLGYIFEQYINDRAAMGAYYTKEDITDYIGKNCILPFLMERLAETDKAAFNPDGEVWTMLRQSGDRYIYDAVKDGYTADWASRIPEDIAVGIDTSKPNLLARRKKWNTPTIEPWALHTEIWRETIERLQRCDMLLEKIKRGDITSINDFITFNLDIRSFVYDLLANTDDHKMLLHFYHALQQVTILDPTCGSGAFLFAAMNILEPLYEVCIERMEEWNRENPNLFKPELAEISNKYRSNIQYFIYKSIILRNLYGVDIMVEATEIAKLRLFLKMVAVVEVDRTAPNMGLDPLPDIDFNVRCGNTLVGYATEAQLNEDLNRDTDILQMEANQQFKKKLVNELAIVATVYDRFKEVQFTQETDMAAFKAAKKDLKKRLDVLNSLLNQRLFKASGIGDYDEWLVSYQPFHWMAEFYQIMHGNNGFDVIIGNPPYVECKRSYFESINASDEVKSSGNLYSAILYRSKSLVSSQSTIGFIVPISYISTKQHSFVRRYLENGMMALYSSYDIRPAHLFEGAAQRLTICVYVPYPNSVFFIEKQLRWHVETRNNLFKLICYRIGFDVDIAHFRYGDCKSHDIMTRFSKNLKSMEEVNDTGFLYYVATTANNFIKAINKQPRYTTNYLPSKPSGWREMTVSKKHFVFTICFINSSFFYWMWKSLSDGFNLTSKFITTFTNVKITEELINDLSPLYTELMKAFQLNSEPHIRNQKTTGRTEIQLFRVKPLKPLIDKIDYVIMKHLGMSDSDIDFVINYDIKYRMGDELNNE